MSSHLLKRKHQRPVAQLDLAPGLSLQKGRLHEACGGARRSFALWLATRAEGRIFWISPRWCPDQLHPDGVARFTDPGRFTFVSTIRDEDVLWTMEEVLRTGIVPLVVADLPGYPALTPVRRLHLAAERGAETNGRAPVGLILTPDHGGAPGVESRWHMRPTHRPKAEAWQLTRLRARTAPVKSWQIRVGDKGFHVAPKSDPAPDAGPQNGTKGKNDLVNVE